MLKVKDINEIHAEITTKCQAACPLCSRNHWGYKERTDFPLTELTIDDWKKIFDTVKDLNPSIIVFNGNFGEPTIAKDFINIVDYCFNRWPTYLEIFVHTNGGARSERWWAEVGEKYKDKRFEVAFGIDGLEDTNHIYRINVPYQKVIANSKAFIDAGGKAHWKMIPFKHNEHQLKEAKLRSELYGFKSFELFDQNRDNGYVYTSDTTGYLIEPASYKNHQFIFQLPKQYAPRNTDGKISSEWHNKLLKSFLEGNRKLNCMTLQSRSIFLAANGEMYPCCYIGHYPTQYTKFNNNFTYALGDVKNNALEVGFEEAISWFHKVQESWSKNSFEEGLITHCMSCVSKAPLQQAKNYPKDVN